MTRKIICAAVVLLAVIAAAGCDKGEQSLGELVVSQQTAELPQKSAFPVEICSVEIDSAPERVVSLSPAVTEIVCELGFENKLCGISDYCDFPDGIAVQAVGSSENPDLEGIKALSPDVVLTLSELSERDEYDLTSAGIAVISLSAVRGLSDYAALYSDIAKCFYGGELNQSEKQTEICTAIAGEALAALDSAAQDVSLGSFVYVTSKLTAAGADTFEGSVLSLVGENVCTQSGYVEIPENIAPAYIIADAALKDDAAAGAALSAISYNAKIIYVSAQPFERPSARICGVFDEIREEFESGAEDVG